MDDKRYTPPDLLACLSMDFNQKQHKVITSFLHPKFGIIMLILFF